MVFRDYVTLLETLMSSSSREDEGANSSLPFMLERAHGAAAPAGTGCRWLRTGPEGQRRQPHCCNRRSPRASLGERTRAVCDLLIRAHRASPSAQSAVLCGIRILDVFRCTHTQELYLPRVNRNSIVFLTSVSTRPLQRITHNTRASHVHKRSRITSRPQATRSAGPQQSMPNSLHRSSCLSSLLGVLHRQSSVEEHLCSLPSRPDACPSWRPRPGLPPRRLRALDHGCLISGLGEARIWRGGTRRRSLSGCGSPLLI